MAVRDGNYAPARGFLESLQALGISKGFFVALKITLSK
jgi:hypothetical protein